MEAGKEGIKGKKQGRRAKQDGSGYRWNKREGVKGKGETGR